MSARTDATSALIAAIREEAGPGFVLEAVRSRRWASVTFAGARHEVTFRIEGAGAGIDRISRALEGVEIRANGHILADLAILGTNPIPEGLAVRVEALTVED